MLKRLTKVLKLFPHFHRLHPGILGSLAVVLALSSSGTTTPVDRVSSLVTPTATSASKTQPDEATKARVLEAYSKLPLRFEANQGQLDQQVQFLARGSGYSVFLTPTEAVLALRRVQGQSKAVSKQPETPVEATAKTESTVLRMQVIGTNPKAKGVALESLAGKSNYIIGNDSSKWHTNVANYAKVKYQGVYPGIDMVYYGNQRQLQYDFIVAPGADPKTIRLKMAGADRLEVDQQGDLVIHTQGGVVRKPRPVIYQEVNGRRQSVAGGFVLLSEKEVGFAVAAYDRSQLLVIDPVISYSTFLGGRSTDGIYGIAVDSAGKVYVTGYSTSDNYTSGNFPTTPGAYDRGGGWGGVIVAKMNLAASGAASLVYSTFLGGRTQLGLEQGYGIAVDSGGNAYVTGYTTSPDFPIKNGFKTTKSSNQDQDAFVTKLNASGSALLYSTFLGGSNSDYAKGIAVGSGGKVYVTGYTYSSNFSTKNAFDPTFGPHSSNIVAPFDAFVTKINPAASGAASLLYSTYLGGNSNDSGNAIAVDAYGYAYVTGYTNSSNFPLKNAFRSTLEFQEAFVTKLNPAASGAASLVYSTFLGGNNLESGNGIAVDSGGNAYVTGSTASPNFPTKNAFATKNSVTVGGSNDVFVTKLNATGNTLLYSTYLGGTAQDYGVAIAVGSGGHAYVTGVTSSTNFPTKSAFDTTKAGFQDIFVARLNTGASGANSLVYSSYLGGSSNMVGTEYPSGIGLDSAGNVYVAGQTTSSDFPTTSNAFDRTLGTTGQADFDGFVTKIAP